MDQELIFKKIKKIENELNNLKNIILSKTKKNIVSLKGILEGIEITDKEITDSKKSLFKNL